MFYDFLGVMSASYHLCPTAHNLQFDVTYIFIMLTIIITKNLSTHNGSAGTLGLATVGYAALISMFSGDPDTGLWIIGATGPILAPVHALTAYHENEWSQIEVPVLNKMVNY